MISGAMAPRRLQQLLHHAIDPVTDRQAFLERFDMDVRRLLADRLGEHGIDQPDDRCVVGGFEQILRFRQRIGELLEIQLVAEVVHDVDASGLAFVVSRETRVEIVGRDRFQRHCFGRLATCFGERHHRHLWSMHEFQATVIVALDQHAMPLGKGIGQILERQFV